MDEIVLYKSIDGNIKIDVLLENETVWLTQNQMAELFGKSVSTINEHIKNIFAENELIEDSAMRKFGISEFSTKPTNFYNLDVIISVGYRVKSQQGTQFRIWATQRLRDYIVKGFALNDERFTTGSSMNYFKELLDRIRSIRLSEKVFYQQIKDIYTTSSDYDPKSSMTVDFFKKIQNKLLWAVSGKTAAELIYYRANSTLPQMGLISTKVASKVAKSDVAVAKNYLKENEINALKLLVEQYLAFAESQALEHKVMRQSDWINKLEMILTLNDKNILTHAGKIRHDLAEQKVGDEYRKFRLVEKETQKLNSIKELDEDLKRIKNTSGQ